MGASIIELNCSTINTPSGGVALALLLLRGRAEWNQTDHSRMCVVCILSQRIDDLWRQFFAAIIRRTKLVRHLEQLAMKEAAGNELRLTAG